MCIDSETLEFISFFFHNLCEKIYFLLSPDPEKKALIK